MFDGVLTLDAAAFFLDWKDLQTGAAFAAGITGLVNAGTAESKGFEAALFLHPLAGLNIGANFAYTDAKCTETTDFCNNGARLPSIPKVAAALTADYNFDVSSSARARVGGALRFVGKRISDVDPDVAVTVGSYTALDLNAGVTFDSRWTLRAYGRNLTDSKGPITSGVSTPNPGFLATVPLQPRTLGLAVDLAF